MRGIVQWPSCGRCCGPRCRPPTAKTYVGDSCLLQKNLLDISGIEIPRLELIFFLSLVWRCYCSWKSLAWGAISEFNFDFWTLKTMLRRLLLHVLTPHSTASIWGSKCGFTRAGGGGTSCYLVGVSSLGPSGATVFSVQLLNKNCLKKQYSLPSFNLTLANNLNMTPDNRVVIHSLRLRWSNYHIYQKICKGI